MQDVIKEILIPFVGTVLGAACVVFVKNGLSVRVECLLSGFAAGVMVAASVFSLLLPAIESSAHLGKLEALPALVGMWVGFLFLLLFDRAADKFFALSRFHGEAAGAISRGKRTLFLTLAVTLHNLPEGMAVGVALAGLLAGNGSVSAAGVFSLALGIGVQNIPEGAIISLPLRAGGMKKGKAFLIGTLSGVVEPLGALITLLLAGLVTPILPYLLGFAVGAMLSVVVTELIPHMAVEGESAFGALAFALGFSFMTFLDTALG